MKILHILLIVGSVIAPIVTSDAFSQTSNDEVAVLTEQLTVADKSTSAQIIQTLVYEFSEDPRVLKALAVKFKSSGAAIKKQIVFMASQIESPDAEPFLLKALVDPEASVRDEAMSNFRRFRVISADTSSALLALFKHEDPKIRDFSAHILPDYASPAIVKELIAGVSSNDTRVRISSTKALGLYGSIDTVKPILNALVSPDQELRAEAALALKPFPTPEVIPHLHKALKDDYWKVRLNAIIALGWTKTPKALEPMLAAIKQGNETEKNNALYLLSQVGVPEAIDPLLTLLASDDHVARVRAVNGLGNIESPRVLKPIISALKDNNAVIRARAAKSLGRSTSKLLGINRKSDFINKEASLDLIKELSPLLKSEDKHVRSMVTAALAYLKEPSAIEKIIGFLKDDRLSRLAQEAIFDAPLKEAEPALIALFKSDIANHTRYLATALAKVNSSQAVDALLTGLQKDIPDEAKHSIISALAEVNDNPMVVKQLLTILNSGTNLSSTAGMSLGKLKVTEATDKLISLLPNNAAINSLIAMNTDEAIAPLLQILKGSNTDNKLSILSDLQYSKLDAAIAPLIEGAMAGGQNVPISLRSLSIIGAEEAIEPVIQLLADESIHIRMNASDALRMILKLDTKAPQNYIP